jgi:uncharacterized membrane protein YhaH (DUF805 family)
MSWGHYLFGFGGRLNRRPYWLSIPVAFGFLAAAVVIALPYVIIEHPDASDPAKKLSPFGIATIACECLLVLAYVVFAFALMVKRLHDRNRSAWWIVPFFLVPELLELIADPNSHPPIAMPTALRLSLISIAVGLSLWAFVDLGFLRGTVGDNRYGPDPLGGHS